METLYTQVQSWLEDNDLHPEVLAKDQILRCKISGLTIGYCFNPKDKECFSVVIAGIMDTQKLGEETVYNIANQTNALKKAVKSFIDGDGDLSLSIEILSGPDPDLDAILPRAHKMLLAACLYTRGLAMVHELTGNPRSAGTE